MEKYLSKNWLCCSLVGLFAVLLWGQTTAYDFVWDDEILIVQNQSIRSLANIPKFFHRADMQAAGNGPTAYRPMRNTAYALLYALDGRQTPQPWIFHLANVLWHAAACMMLFLVALLLCRRLTGGDSVAARMAALLIALGFAAHPVNSEVICWTKGMDDLMAAVFVLASARSVLKWQENRRGYAAALVWFLLAAFSKESAVPFALVVFFIFYGFHELPWRRSAKLAIPFFLVAFFYVVCRHLVMGRTSQCHPLSGSYVQSLIDMFPVAPEYLRLLFGIPPFCADYYFMFFEPPHWVLSAPVVNGGILVLFSVVLAAWLWPRPKWRLSAFGIIWLVLFLLPVSNLVPMMQYMADRFLYMPLIGFLLATGAVFLNFPRWRLAAAVAGAAIIAIWTGTSLDRMTIWQDNLTLFVRTELEHPGIKRIEQNAVFYIVQLPQIRLWHAARRLPRAQGEQLIATLQKARQIYPENDLLTTELGLAEAKIGRWREAVWLVELATRQNPDSADRWYDLASLYRMDGQPAKAQAAVGRALRLSPQFKDAQQLQAKLAKEMKPAAAANAPALK